MPGHLSGGDEPIVEIAAEAELRQAPLIGRSAFAGVGQDGDRLLFCLEMFQRGDGAGIGVPAVMKNAELVEQKQVERLNDVRKTLDPRLS